ncbi:MAG: hypothetical protein IBX55_00330 [Methyloprofundus sp.]|nr:hypothetical protein [Methyloprofundus sp.]
MSAKINPENTEELISLMNSTGISKWKERHALQALALIEAGADVNAKNRWGSTGTYLDRILW